jgi:hypothetical protein
MILAGEYDVNSIAARALAVLDQTGIARETAVHLAVAVAAFSSSGVWSQSELEFRLARALNGIGHADAARVLLRNALGPRADDHSDGSRAEKILSAPPDLFPLIRAGALRAAEENAWRLDASALSRPDVPLELSYARLIDFFSARLLPLWEESQGRGELALTGFRGHARSFTSNRRDAARRCRAWRRDLADALSTRASNRGWPAAPRVVLAEPV